MRDILNLENKELILNILLFFVAFSLPFSYAFNSIAIAVLFFYSFIFFKREVFLSSITLKKIYIYYFLFFLIQIISIFYSNNKDLAIKFVVRNVVFFIIPITFINLKNKINKNKFKFFFYGMLIAVLSLLISAYFNIVKIFIFDDINLKNIVREKFIEFGILDIHVPYLAILVVFLLICSNKITFNKQDKINIIIRFTLISFLVLSLIQLSGFMSIFILGVFLLSEFLFSRISIKSKLIVITLISVSFIFLIPLLEKSEPTIRVRGAENIIYRTQQLLESKDPVRRENWESVIKVVSSNILLGVGADGGMELLQKERDIYGEPYINEHNAHNDLLEILLRYGLVGLSIFLLILVNLAKKAFLTRNYYFIWFLIVFIISGITESYLQRQIGLVFFVFVSLLFYTYKENDLLEINTI